jgi:hypothetical protein
MFRTPEGSPISSHITPSSKQVLFKKKEIGHGIKYNSIKDSKSTGPYREANSDGFSTAVHPAAREGATFHVAINRG